MGLTLEDPEYHIEWRIAQSAFLASFPEDRLKQVNAAYYTAKCVSHHGLHCMVGFHFGRFPRQSKELLLYQLEFFRDSAMDLRASYEDFQQHFEATYGPGEIVQHSLGFPIYRWQITGAEIRHLVQERFGLEEHLRISF